MENDEVRFRFGPPVRATFLGGVRHAQAAFLGVAFGSAVVFLRTIGGQLGVGIAIATLIAGIGAAFGTIEGRPFDDWVPACSRWVVLVVRGRRNWRSPAPWIGERSPIPPIIVATSASEPDLGRPAASNGHTPPGGPTPNGVAPSGRRPNGPVASDGGAPIGPTPSHAVAAAGDIAGPRSPGDDGTGDGAIVNGHRPAPVGRLTGSTERPEIPAPQPIDTPARVDGSTATPEIPASAAVDGSSVGGDDAAQPAGQGPTAGSEHPRRPARRGFLGRLFGRRRGAKRSRPAEPARTPRPDGRARPANRREAGPQPPRRRRWGRRRRAVTAAQRAALTPQRRARDTDRASGPAEGTAATGDPPVDSAPVRATRPIRMAGKPSPPPPVKDWQLIYTSVSGQPMGVLRDRKNKTWIAVIAVQGQSFMLLDESEQIRRLSSWAAVQTSMARQGSPISRMQWIERTLTEVGDEMRTFFDERAASTAGSGAHASYQQLLQSAQPVTQQHETYLVLQVSQAKAGRAIRHAGGGDKGAVAVLYRELQHLQRQLRESDLSVNGFLSGDQLAMVLRTQFDPEDALAMAARRSMTQEPLVSARSAWPMATEVSWGHYRTDRMYHITYWVSEWPKLGVRPSFLSPLLLTSNGVTRTVSVVSEPIPMARAMRKIEHQQTSRLSDEELRSNAGYRTGARRRREAEALDRRENELADGHAENRYSGYVTVSGPNLDEVEVAAAMIEQIAYQCPVELRRLWGEQDTAFYCTMPMTMGLA